MREPADGNDLTLSIDSKHPVPRLRRIARRGADPQGKAGAVVVLDAHTGEILALANWPTYDPNQRGQCRKRRLRNRVLTDTFEPGSTMKPFTIARRSRCGDVTPST